MEQRLEELERTVASQKAVIEQQTAMMEAQNGKGDET